MSQKLYRHVLIDAWAVTWRHPGLWIFGAFALFMGQSQFFYSLAGLFEATTWGTRLAGAIGSGRQWLIPIISPSSWTQVLFGVLLAAAVFAVMLLFVFMIIQAQGAIMSAGDYIFRKRLYSFSAAWHTALEHFWGLVGIIVLKIIAALVISLGTVGLGVLINFVAPNSWWPKVIFVIGFVILALLDILVTFVALYSTCFLVLEKQKLGPAIKLATQLFAKHWLASLEIGIIFLVLNVVALIIAKFVFAILFVPLFYFAALVKFATGFLAPVVIINLTILIAAVWWIMAIYTTWFFMAVVALFDHMTGDTVVSKTIRFVRSLVARE